MSTKNVNKMNVIRLSDEDVADLYDILIDKIHVINNINSRLRTESLIKRANRLSQLANSIIEQASKGRDGL